MNHNYFFVAKQQDVGVVSYDIRHSYSMRLGSGALTSHQCLIQTVMDEQEAMVLRDRLNVALASKGHLLMPSGKPLSMTTEQVEAAFQLMTSQGGKFAQALSAAYHYANDEDKGLIVMAHHELIRKFSLAATVQQSAGKGAP